MDHIEGDLIAKDEKIEDIENKINNTLGSKDFIKQVQRNNLIGKV